MTVNSDHQKNAFQSRLKRIRKGGPNTMGQVYIGSAEDGIDVNDAIKPHFGIVATLISLVLGAAAYLLGDLIQFHLVSEMEAMLAEYAPAEAMPYVTDYGNFILAAAIFLLFMVLARLRGRGALLTGALAIAVTPFLLPKVWEAYPEIEQALYSPLDFAPLESASAPNGATGAANPAEG